MKTPCLLLWTQDNKLSEKFYKKLGFQVLHSDNTFSRLVLNGFEIQLISLRDDPEFARDVFSGDRGRGMYICVPTENAHETYDELRHLGIKPSTQPRDWPWGTREFIVKDPDGYKICFTQPL